MSDLVGHVSDYLVADLRGLGEDRLRRTQAVFAQLEREGWRQALALDGLCVLLGPRSRLKVRQVHRRHILIGDWRGRGRALSAVIGGSRGSLDLARGVVAEGWGRYILLWIDNAGRLCLLRDPSGALDCLWWITGGARFVARNPPQAINPLLPTDLAIDWPALAALARSPQLISGPLPLVGLHAVTAGDLALVGDDEKALDVRPIWRPADFCHKGTSWDESPERLVALIDQVVEDLVTGHERVLCELSGGLDSSIVSSSIVARNLVSKTSFLNFHDDRPEGDERRYALAASAKLAVPLTTVRKPVRPITFEEMAQIAFAARPALHGLDPVYDVDVAERARTNGATGLVTGQGGDAVFFQSPDPRVYVDRLHRRPLRWPEPGYLFDVARWTRRSAWCVASLAFEKRPSASMDCRHPWLTEMEGLPPAKAAQIGHLANAGLFWGDCRRSRQAELLHPLLSQPVMEHCLAIPTDRLTQGGRDRALARQAFRRRLPALVVERRDKGDLSCFYGKVVRSSAPMLRDLLLTGRLCAQGILDRDEVERGLADADLVWDAASSRFLVFAQLEAWALVWERRIASLER